MQQSSTMVSIHARHCWRANPVLPHIALRFLLVSIHARHCWRANRWSARPGRRRQRCFNPRPPLLAGESTKPLAQSLSCCGFQSTPAIAGGRIGRQSFISRSMVSFNPRPPLLAGESPSSSASPSSQSGFNPRPPLLAGESLLDGLHAAVEIEVSIHARHCWRANLASHQDFGKIMVFQSTPAIAGGRIGISVINNAPDVGFNPRPPLLAGESRHACAGSSAPLRFNPRPPLLAGESL